MINFKKSQNFISVPYLFFKICRFFFVIEISKFFSRIYFSGDRLDFFSLKLNTFKMTHLSVRNLFRINHMNGVSSNSIRSRIFFPLEAEDGKREVGNSRRVPSSCRVRASQQVDASASPAFQECPSRDATRRRQHIGLPQSASPKHLSQQKYTAERTRLTQNNMNLSHSLNWHWYVS